MYKFKEILLTFIFSIAYMPLAFATPVIGIGSMYDVLTPGVQSMTKRIYNTGDSTAFVRVELLEISPGNKSKTAEVEFPLKEVTGNKLEKDRLIVTPLRMIIPPEGFQAVRILWPGERTAERYFRIRFTPVMPDVNDNFGLDNKEMNEYRNKALQAGVNILTGYGTILIVQPDKPLFNTVVKSDSTGNLTVKNEGNATISLDNLRYCKTANTDCGEVTRELILPGRSHAIKKKESYKTNFTLIEGNNKKSMSY